MQHDHVLKRLNFDLLTQSKGSGEGVLRAKYLLPCCCIRDSLLFVMQQDNVLEKMNLDLLTPSPGSWVGGRGSVGMIFPTILLHL